MSADLSAKIKSNEYRSFSHFNRANGIFPLALNRYSAQTDQSELLSQNYTKLGRAAERSQVTFPQNVYLFQSLFRPTWKNTAFVGYPSIYLLFVRSFVCLSVYLFLFVALCRPSECVANRHFFAMTVLICLLPTRETFAPTNNGIIN